eukprot:TRINITY_DN90469_c0_g1_i1.p2 TRINITY_DN90469_c0_g1~~TRINITY_DN90469_c0_g1_i1.p2  ORF type:complete len:112 (+),score=2.86 TRINITY_DN90469_c0_g1_i1:247-582(+)
MTLHRLILCHLRGVGWTLAVPSTLHQNAGREPVTRAALKALWQSWCCSHAARRCLSWSNRGLHVSAFVTHLGEIGQRSLALYFALHPCIQQESQEPASSRFHGNMKLLFCS